MCVFYSKKLFTAVHNFVHLNLAIALFIGYLVFAVGVEFAKDNKVEYITIGIKHALVIMLVKTSCVVL